MMVNMSVYGQMLCIVQYTLYTYIYIYIVGIKYKTCCVYIYIYIHTIYTMYMLCIYNLIGDVKLGLWYLLGINQLPPKKNGR